MFQTCPLVYLLTSISHSGISWAVNAGSKTVKLVDDWPERGTANANSDKVATKITYKNGQPYEWGNDVDGNDDSLEWFKLLLDDTRKYGEDANRVTQLHHLKKLLKKAGKKAEDVATDYLRLLWEYTLKDIERERGRGWQDAYVIKPVLTVPAIWSDRAKDTTLRIAQKAGIPGDIDLVSEPEAAALAVLKDMHRDDEPLQRGDAFVVCDAGGGTVDLISYRIVDTNPLRMEECATGGGGLCGSVFLDQSFEHYIRSLVGVDEYSNLKPSHRRRMMRDFELNVKRRFKGDDKPLSVDLIGVEDDPENGIDDCTIALKP